MTFGYLAGRPADGPAVRDDDPAVPERQLRQRPADLQPQQPGLAWGGIAARARLALDHVLVGVGGGRLCDLRARSTRTRRATRSWRCAPPRCSRCSSTSCCRSHSWAAARRARVAATTTRSAMDEIIGSTRLTDFLLVCLCVSFIISMNTATADGGRALFGISRDGMTIKQLGDAQPLPRARQRDDARHGRQHRRSCCSSATSSASSPRRNLGYVLAHMFALSGFVLLRRDRPNWPRPIKLGAVWTPIAGILAVWCLILTIVGFGWMQVAAGGYGGTKEKIIGVSVLRDRDRALPLPPHRPGRRDGRTGARRHRRCRMRPRRR